MTRINDYELSIEELSVLAERNSRYEMIVEINNIDNVLESKRNGNQDNMWDFSLYYSEAYGNE